MRGRTYTLTDHAGSSSGYYNRISRVADKCIEDNGGAGALLGRLRRASGRKTLLQKLFGTSGKKNSIASVIAHDLAGYTTDAAHHLSTLSISDRMDPTISTPEEDYHLNMLEIEVANRVNVETFKGSTCKMALIAHCLRDFREGCIAEPGDIESICRYCNRECFVNRGGRILEKYGIEPYISTTMDHKKLFSELKKRHPDMGALGIACIPELVEGMRLCNRLGIPAVGIPLDVNRCARWLGKTQESLFNVRALEELLSR